MGRSKIGSDLMQVRFPDGTFDRIDATGGNRSEFIRSAVAAKLGGEVAATKSAAPCKKVSTDVRAADEAVLLAAIRSKPMSSRDLERRMGWLGLRYSRAEKALLASGVVSLDRGLLVIEG